MRTTTSTDDHETEFRKLRDETRKQTAIVLEGDDLLWVYRRIRASPRASNASFHELRGLVEDSLWTTRFNDWSHHSFADVQALASNYLAESRLHCTQLRNFFIRLLVGHLWRLNAIERSAFVWAAAWASIFLLGIFLTYRSSTSVEIIGGVLAGVGLLAAPYIIDVVSKFARTSRTEPLLSQVADETGRGAFDAQITEERLKRLEERGIRVPSIVYSLLQQPKIDVEQCYAAEWNALPQWQKDEIYDEHIDWIRNMTARTER